MVRLVSVTAIAGVASSNPRNAIFLFSFCHPTMLKAPSTGAIFSTMVFAHRSTPPSGLRRPRSIASLNDRIQRNDREASRRHHDDLYRRAEIYRFRDCVARAIVRGVVTDSRHKAIVRPSPSWTTAQAVPRRRRYGYYRAARLRTLERMLRPMRERELFRSYCAGYRNHRAP